MANGKMKILLFISLLLNLIITGCSSNEASKTLSREIRIEQLIEKKKYTEAKVLLEETLVENPFNVVAAQQLNFINKSQLNERNKNRKKITCPIDVIKP